MTPPALASALVRHFNPTGHALDPCRGTGAFFDAFKMHKGRQVKAGALVDQRLNLLSWCELAEGRDFLKHMEPCDWIISNPPWSKVADFMAHAFALADNVAFLITINHAFTLARRRDTRAAGFHIAEIVEFGWPKAWTRSGFQLGAVRWKRTGQVDAPSCRFSVLEWKDQGEGGTPVLDAPPAPAGLFGGDMPE